MASAVIERSYLLFLLCIRMRVKIVSAIDMSPTPPAMADMIPLLPSWSPILDARTRDVIVVGT